MIFVEYNDAKLMFVELDEQIIAHLFPCITKFESQDLAVCKICIRKLSNRSVTVMSVKLGARETGKNIFQFDYSSFDGNSNIYWISSEK